MISGDGKKIVDSTVWLIGVKLFIQVMTFSSTIVTARVLGVAEFGAINFGILVIGLLDTLLEFGFLAGIIREKEVSGIVLSSCFWLLTLASGLIIALVLWLAWFLEIDDAYKEVLYLLIWGLLFFPYQTISRAVISRNLRLDLIAKSELIGALFRNLISLVGLFLGFGVKGVVIGFIVERLIGSLILGLHARWLPSLSIEITTIKNIINFGLKNTLARLIWYFSSKADSFFVGFYFGKETLGVYSIALQIVNMPFQAITSSAHKVIYSAFSKFISGFNFVLIFRKTLWLVSAFSVPMCMGLFLIAEKLIVVVYGNKWFGAVGIIRWLSVAVLMQIYSSIWPLYWNAAGRPSIDILYNITNCVITIFSICILGNFGDFEYVPVAVLFRSFVSLVAVFYITKHLIDFSVADLIKDFLAILVGALIFFPWYIFVERKWGNVSSGVCMALVIVGSIIIYSIYTLCLVRSSKSFWKSTGK